MRRLRNVIILFESTTSSTVAVKAFSLFLPIETRETEPITMDQNGRAQNHKVEDN